MIARYTRAEMGRIWSDENKYRMWLEVESAASETLAEDGIVPAEAAKAIRERGKIDVARINQIEAEVVPVRFVAVGRSREELVERGTR